MRIGRWDRIEIEKLEKKLGGAIVGMVLGDGYLATAEDRDHARLVFSHCPKQREYALWKAALLEKLHPSVGEYADKRFDTSTIRVTTRCHPFLTQLRATLYPSGKKKISREALDRLNPLGLAIWYMDDGGRKYLNVGPEGNLELYTYAYGEDGNAEIQQFLQERWGIKTNIHRWRKNPYIYIRAASRTTFADLIAPFVNRVPCMRYKLPPTARSIPTRDDEIVWTAWKHAEVAEMTTRLAC